MTKKPLSLKLIQRVSICFVLMLLALGVVFITQKLYAQNPFVAGMVLMVLIFSTPLAVVIAFYQDHTQSPSKTPNQSKY